MPTEKLEIDIIAKGKPAEKAIKGVEKRTNELGDATKKTGKDVDGVLTKMRAGYIAVGVAIVKALQSGREFERASIGLSKEMKNFAMETAKLSDVTATQVAGFLKSAETAGLAEEQMKRLAEQAIALGYAFPHEDAETLHDNLVMLNTTGEAQGFIVDILEQKLSAMGIAFEDIDLKALSVEEKLRLVNEVVADSSKALDESNYKGLNEALTSMNTSLIKVGDTLMTFLEQIGVFTLLNKALQSLDLLLSSVSLGFIKLKNVISDTEENQKALTEATKAWDRAYDNLFGVDLATEIKDLSNELNNADSATLNMVDSTKKLTKEGERLKKEMSDNDKELKKLGSTGQKVATTLAQGFANMAIGVKSNFKDMAKAIIADFVRVRTQAYITEALTGLSQSSSIFSFLSPHTGTKEVKHTGGMVGVPSYHMGMRSDERLAKLQVGEAVVNRAGASRNRNAIDAMNAGYQVGGGGNVTQAEINFNVTAIDANSFNNYLVGNKQTIENIINNSLQTNGTVRQTIKQVI